MQKRPGASREASAVVTTCSEVLTSLKPSSAHNDWPYQRTSSQPCQRGKPLGLSVTATISPEMSLSLEERLKMLTLANIMSELTIVFLSFLLAWSWILLRFLSWAILPLICHDSVSWLSLLRSSDLEPHHLSVVSLVWQLVSPGCLRKQGCRRCRQSRLS